MKREGTRTEDLTVAYIGGGSRGWAWGFMKDLGMDPQMEGVVRLYDIDKDAAEKNRSIGDMISSHPEAKSHWRYEVSGTLKEALAGADFIVISILPGHFGHMRSDVHWPEKYGIWQPVGDTVGPGGLMRALRTVPMFVQIALAIRDFAPRAWVINYTNPMTVCMNTLYAVFPDIRAFGCCHEVFGTQKLLAQMLEDLEGIRDVKREDIRTGVTGINHFTFLYSASYEGLDLFPLYRRFVDRYYQTGFLKGKDDNWMNNNFECSHRVKFDLFRRYGLIAAAGDRHLAEFMPPWYLKDPNTAKEWGFSLTSVDWREKDLSERLAKRAALLSGAEPIDMKESGEEGHLLLKALLGLGDMVSNVNIPNRGQIPNLPEGAVVEINAFFSRDAISPMYSGPLPHGVDALVSRHCFNQLGIVKAAMTCDWNLALNVLLNDPQTCRLNPLDTQKMFAEMIGNTIDILPEAWKRAGQAGKEA